MATTQEKREGSHQIVVRMPVSLHDELKRRAAEEQRSVTAHVRWLVERDAEAA
jgi:predicted HicB family RNase H-like nuclease